MEVRMLRVGDFWVWEFLSDVLFMNRLMFGLLRPKPGKQILGADIAGTVEAVGRHVTRFRPGDQEGQAKRKVIITG